MAKRLLHDTYRLPRSLDIFWHMRRSREVCYAYGFHARTHRLALGPEDRVAVASNGMRGHGVFDSRLGNEVKCNRQAEVP